jgi:uronate dehydrogenase
MTTVLMTGAAGNIGQALRSRLARPGRVLRLLDVAQLTAGPGEEVVTASVTDLDAVARACVGVDAVVHLAGIAGEAPFEEILTANVLGTRAVFEGAVKHGVGRVVLASSNHAVGFQRGDGAPLSGDVGFAPDTWYGWSKAAIEAMGSLYHHRFGIDVIALRIGTFSARPSNRRALGTWLSPDDAGRLVEAALTVPSPGFRLVWGISANTARWWSLAEAEALGYLPADDAEAYAAQLPPEADEPYVGGPFTRLPLGDR